MFPPYSSVPDRDLRPTHQQSCWSCGRTRAASQVITSLVTGEGFGTLIWRRLIEDLRFQGAASSSTAKPFSTWWTLGVWKSRRFVLCLKALQHEFQRWVANYRQQGLFHSKFPGSAQLSVKSSWGREKTLAWVLSQSANIQTAVASSNCTW